MIEINPAGFIGRQNDHMGGPHLFDGQIIRFHGVMYFLKRHKTAGAQTILKLQKDHGRAFRIVHSPVVIVEHDVQLPGDKVKAVARKLRQKDTA